MNTFNKMLLVVVAGLAVGQADLVAMETRLRSQKKIVMQSQAEIAQGLVEAERAQNAAEQADRERDARQDAEEAARLKAQIAALQQSKPQPQQAPAQRMVWGRSADNKRAVVQVAAPSYYDYVASFFPSRATVVAQGKRAYAKVASVMPGRPALTKRNAAKAFYATVVAVNCANPAGWALATAYVAKKAYDKGLVGKAVNAGKAQVNACKARRAAAPRA